MWSPLATQGINDRWLGLTTHRAQPVRADLSEHRTVGIRCGVDCVLEANRQPERMTEHAWEWDCMITAVMPENPPSPRLPCHHDDEPQAGPETMPVTVTQSPKA
eukprot:3064182-Rhodomonas_salina.2